MKPTYKPTPAGDRLAAVAGDLPRERPGVHTVATRDHDEIRQWAALHQAEPATGEVSASGPAVLNVNDGGAGVRFNFPGFAVLRPIAWDEWFDNFDRHNLLFVYETEDTNQVRKRAHARWESRGREEGRAHEDWYAAEHELHSRAGGGSPSVRYRIVKDRGIGDDATANDDSSRADQE
jgi:hypothetical protein